jgi:two-component system chemotaxis response regulator CheB
LSPAVSTPIRLLPINPYPTRALLIGSSTGGPQALMKIATDLGPVIDRHPVLITQHMPPTFTTILAEHLARVSQRPAREGVDGETVRPGQIYLAPGGKHMCVARRGAEIVVVLNDEPPINYCKPAVDPLFQSAAAIWQGGVLATILTGMGADGMRGAKDIVAAGGNVIVQDEASSVVWGMPGAAAHAGVCAAVLPLDQIASKLNKLFLGDRA